MKIGGYLCVKSLYDAKWKVVVTQLWKQVVTLGENTRWRLGEVGHALYQNIYIFNIIGLGDAKALAV